MQREQDYLQVTGPPRPVVLLRHEGGESTPHVDWMIAKDASGYASLATFRLSTRLDTLDTAGSVAAERIRDHRPRYLRCDGSLGHGKGGVRLLARGRIRACSGVHDETNFEIYWLTGPSTGHAQRLALVTTPSGCLSVECKGWNGRSL